jgi:hypothetical protein
MWAADLSSTLISRPHRPNWAATGLMVTLLSWLRFVPRVPAAAHPLRVSARVGMAQFPPFFSTLPSGLTALAGGCFALAALYFLAIFWRTVEDAAASGAEAWAKTAVAATASSAAVMMDFIVDSPFENDCGRGKTPHECQMKPEPALE